MYLVPRSAGEHLPTKKIHSPQYLSSYTKIWIRIKIVSLKRKICFSQEEKLFPSRGKIVSLKRKNCFPQEENLLQQKKIIHNINSYKIKHL
jgi:hypothetical protein